MRDVSLPEFSATEPETPNDIRTGPTVSGFTRDGNHLTIGPDVNINDVHFPIAYLQIRDLIGKALTIIDALGLPEGQAKASKDLTRQAVHAWFADAQENSMTSYRGCIAPIETLRAANGTERKYVWHAEGDHAISV